MQTLPTIEPKHEVRLSMISRLLNTALDQEALLVGVTDLTVPLLGDFCAIELLAEGRWDRVAVSGAEPACLGADGALFTLVAGEAIGTGETCYSPGRRRWVVVPLFARGEIIGRMVLAKAKGDFSDADVALAEEIARQTALAAHNASLVRSLKRSVAARAELLAVVSHELKNLLTSMKVNVEFLELGAQQSKPMGYLRNAVVRMERVTADLLDSERIDLGRLPLDRSSCDIESLFEELARMFLPLAERSGINLLVEQPPEGLPDLDCDRQRVVQALTNLVTNALKFTPAGGSVSLTARLDESGEVVLEVRDTGPGIHAEDLARVFDRYWQAEQTAQLGTGLGLYVTKGIVEAHGGKIWVTSETGRGATFAFSLPATTAFVKEKHGT